MYSTYNEEKYVVAERFIRALKNKIFKDMTAISKLGQKIFLLLIKLKIQFLGLMLLVISMMKKLLEVFMKKNCKKLIKKNFE